MFNSILFIFFFRAQISFSQNDTNGISDIDSFLINTMETYYIPGLAATIVKGYSIFWKGFYGWAKEELS